MEGVEARRESPADTFFKKVYAGEVLSESPCGASLLAGTSGNLFLIDKTGNLRDFSRHVPKPVSRVSPVVCDGQEAWFGAAYFSEVPRDSSQTQGHVCRLRVNEDKAICFPTNLLEYKGSLPFAMTIEPEFVWVGLSGRIVRFKRSSQNWEQFTWFETGGSHFLARQGEWLWSAASEGGAGGNWVNLFPVHGELRESSEPVPPRVEGETLTVSGDWGIDPMAILPHSSGIWFATDQGLARYSPEQKTISIVALKGTVILRVLDAGERLVLVTGDSLQIYEPRTSKALPSAVSAPPRMRRAARVLEDIFIVTDDGIYTVPLVAVLAPSTPR